MKIELLDRMAEVLGPDAVEKVRFWAAVKGFELKELSMGAGAELAGMTVAEFMLALGRLKISVIADLTPDELEEDAAVAARAAGRRPEKKK
jgi:predicted HTH domain antitoxin